MSGDCENCAQLADQNHALQQRAQDEFEKREALVNRLTRADREVSALKAQLTKLRTDSPKMADAQEVFDFWVRRLKKNARTVFGPKRQEKVIARLKEKSSHVDIDRKQDLLWAIRGMEALPFVGPQGRQAGAGRGAKRHDDLELVCRDETTVARFSGYATEHAEGAFRSFTEALLRRSRSNVDLDASYDGDQPFHVTAMCPVCNEAFALTAMPGSVVNCEWIWIECTSGCSAERVKEVLRDGARLQVAA